jgi:hypothetical protein
VQVEPASHIPVPVQFCPPHCPHFPIVPPAALEVAIAELLVELGTIGLVEVTKVNDGLMTTDLHEDLTTTELLATLMLLEDGLAMTDEDEDFTVAELIETLLLVDELTTPTLVEVEVFMTTDDENDFTTPALAELAKTELVVALVGPFVVEAGTEEVVIVTAIFVDDEVSLTPPGEAGDQNTAGV